MGSRKNLYLTPSFSLNLGSGIDSGLVCVGKFDGIHPSLVCATEGGKIMIHSPHEKTTLSPENKETKYLSLNRIPTALTTCRIDDRSSAEILIIGTQTNLLVYNVHTNTDVFYKDIPEGVHALCSGKMGHNDSTWIIVGGSCSIQGFDLQGNEVYWSVTGDNVTAMTFSDYNKDGANELIVSSQDCVIRIFSGEEVICEIPTVDSVLQLRSHVNGFVYALGNGTFGSYLDSVKKWRVKSKNKVTTITSHDINEDGVDEIFIGFEDGSFEVYHPFSGALLHKDRLNAPITGVVVADFRQSGRNEIVVCTKDGTLTGFGIGQPSAQIGGDLERKKMSELMQTKQSLHHELTALEEEMRRLRVGEKSELSSESTKLDCKLRPNLDCHSIDLCASVKDGAVIRCLIIHGNMIFGTKEHGVYFSQDPQKTMIARLKPEKDVSTRLEIKALVGIKHAKSHLVLESHYTLPKFCMYVSVNEMLSEPEGNLSFVLSEHSARVIGWMNNNFSSNIDSKASSFKLSFVSLRDSSYLIIQMFQQGTGMNSSTAVTIRVNSIEVAGDIVQDLVASLSILELESVADFPQEFTEFEKVLMKVDEYNSVRMKLTAEMADSSQLVKALVIKAEDARILSDMRYMKRMYSNLYDVNRELIGEYIKRSNNHNELLAALKDVNIMIQKAARLRVGAPKTVVVNECRSAIKSNNVHALFHVMKHGRLP